jgi:hypothetical protein
LTGKSWMRYDIQVTRVTLLYCPACTRPFVLDHHQRQWRLWLKLVPGGRCLLPGAEPFGLSIADHATCCTVTQIKWPK